MKNTRSRRARTAEGNLRSSAIAFAGAGFVLFVAISLDPLGEMLAQLLVPRARTGESARYAFWCYRAGTVSMLLGVWSSIGRHAWPHLQPLWKRIGDLLGAIAVIALAGYLAILFG